MWKTMVEIPTVLNPVQVLKELSFDEQGRWAVPVLNRRKDINPEPQASNVIIKDDTFRE